MKNRSLIIIVSFLLTFVLKSSFAQKKIASFNNGGEIYLQKSSLGKWILSSTKNSLTSILPSSTIGLEIYKNEDAIENYFYGYDAYKKINNGFIGTAFIQIKNACYFKVTDTVRINKHSISFSRKIIVNGNSKGGFLSAIELQTNQQFNRDEIDVFVPGMIYGSTSNLTTSAIGGKDVYKTPNGMLWIREDRMPAPLLGFRLKDSTAISAFNPKPDGSSDTSDTQTYGTTTLIDKKIKLGAFGLNNKKGFFALGYHFPCSEGEYTYKENTYPDGHIHGWRRRYHPMEDGFTQVYHVDFIFSKEASFPAYCNNAWRLAWSKLNPKINYQDIALVQRSLIDMLAERIETKNGLSGITNWTPAANNEKPVTDRKSVMGFTGKTLESANFLLQDADKYKDDKSINHRALATAIFDSYIKFKMNPPVGEGFNLDTGEPALAIPQDKRVYLRSFGDDMKAALKAYIREKAKGKDHPDWLTWIKSFTDWLLTQQYASGGFPRSWKQVTGEIVDSLAQSSFSAIPLLILMTRATGDATYKNAAIKAGEFIWNNGQKNGLFVGGTIDNPNVIDKEAGTLSLEAYLFLLDATGEKKWLEPAQMAANFTQTWIYIWNVPMPVDADNSKLHWKKGVSTIGLQLISTGHSLVDAYMAFDVDEFAHLYKLTNDKHYLEVARLLLHNTKGMMALPGRLYDLRGPGWMQEHWSLAPMRGYGIHRGWLPWVSTSQLNGIMEMEELDARLFNELIHPKIK